MQAIIDDWARSFYSRPFLDLILIIAFIISVKKKNKHRILRFIPIYILALLVVYFTVEVYLVFPLEKRRKLVRFDFFLDHLFTLIELLIFSDFFYKVLLSSFLRKVVRTLTSLFILIFIMGTLLKSQLQLNTAHKMINTFYTFQAIFLILFCILYFIELFKKPPVLNLFEEPSFWVTTGLFFFTSCTLPYSLLENQIDLNYHEYAVELFAIFHVFYSLFFIMIIRAYLCKPIKNI